MKCPSVVAAVVALLSACVHVHPHAFAQEWSAEQKEVWRTVEDVWRLGASRDTEAWLSHFHSDCLNLEYGATVPIGKATTGRWAAYSMKVGKTLMYDIQPIAIRVIGNVAMVVSYYESVDEDHQGNRKYTNGRWFDVLMKQGGKWLIIGGHGGQQNSK